MEKELEAYSFVCAGAFAWNIEVQNRLKTMCGAYPHSCFIWGGWQYAPDTLCCGRSPHGARRSGQELVRALVWVVSIDRLSSYGSSSGWL